MFAAAMRLVLWVPWSGATVRPFTLREVSRSPWVLPAYAGYSLLRIAIAYGLSLGFALAYGLMWLRTTRG